VKADYLKQLASDYRSGGKAYLQVRDFAYQSTSPSSSESRQMQTFCHSDAAV